MDRKVKLFQLQPDGTRMPDGEIAKAAQRLLHTHAGQTWIVESADGKPLGFFVVPAKGAKVLVE